MTPRSARQPAVELGLPRGFRSGPVRFVQHVRHVGGEEDSTLHSTPSWRTPSAPGRRRPSFTLGDSSMIGRLLPYRTLRFVVASPPEKVASALKTNVDETSMFRFRLRGSSEPFRGRVTVSDFKISRRILYRNSFLPTVVGSLRRAGAGCEISVVMRLHYFVAAFMMVWFGGLFFALAGIASAGGANQLTGLCGTGGMLAFGALLVTLGFKFEADKAERLLTEIFAPL